MLRRYALFLSVLTVLILGSCASARKQFEKGNYDRALEISAQKLRKNPADQKHIDILVNAYRIANERDEAELNRLKAENREDNWEQIYNAYRRLDRRQSVVRELPKLRPSNPLTDVEFTYKDYSLEIQKSKTKAVESLYQAGEEHLSKGDRFSARTAYGFYNRAFGYDPNYLDVREKMEMARTSGITRVLFGVNRQTMQPLPAGFEQNLMNVDLSGFNRQWLQIDQVQQMNVSYHYFIEAVITDVAVLPERVRETSYTDTRTIEDGWEYEKNADGSIKRDSLGNGIKRTIYREVTAKVKKTEHEKQCTVNGAVLIYESGSDRRISQDAIYGNANYYYAFGTAKGDSRALSDQSRKLVQNYPQPFPSFSDMVMMASASFNNAVYDKIRQYRSYLD